MTARRRTLLRSLVAASLTVLAAACGSGVPDFALPEPPPAARPTTTTAALDLRAVVLPAVPGRTTTIPPAIGPGRARIEGTVNGPDGPVPGAVVRVERFVGDARASLDVTSGPDGRFAATGILGGRYRVRAWRSPDLVVDRPAVFYLEDATVQQVDVTLSKRDGLDVAASIAPSPPIRGQRANLAVVVTQVQVDGQGIVRTVPVQGLTVQLFASGDWTLYSPNPASTDGLGRAVFSLVCGTAGTAGLSVAVGVETFALDVPSCAPPPTTTTAPTPTTTTASRLPSTTRPNPGNPNRP